MAQRKSLALGIVALLVGLAPLLREAPAAPAGEARPKAMRIGLITSLFPDTPEGLIQVLMRPLRSLLEAQTGLTGEVVAVKGAEALGQDLTEDKVQLAVFHGVEFGWAKLKHPDLKPLVIAVNQHQRLHAHLVVRQDCKAECAGDLKGKTLALPKLSREHCKLFLERRCVPAGSCPQKFYGQVAASVDNEEALDSVVDGTAQAAVIDALGLEAYQRLKPGRFAKVRTLQQSEAFPSAVIAYHPGGLPDALLKSLRDGMTDAKNNRRGQQLLEMCRITSFDAIPEDYDQMLAEIVKAYPPPADGAK
jgi:ABC-type phosphate/phosphonate transport system substrate-binding protein